MFEPVSITEKLMFATARIVGQKANGSVSTGTGFFFGFPGPKGHGRMLVTNKHVVEGVANAQIIVHGFPHQGSSMRPKPTHKLTVNIPANFWVPHPNPKIDLCAVPFGDPPNPENLIPFVTDLNADLIPGPELLTSLSAVEDVLMFGYPNGLWDAVNNFPLARRGITASHPALDFQVDGVPTTALDIAAFPGSSGSPVFIYNGGSVPGKDGSLQIGSRLLFIGVLYSGPVIRADGQIVIRNIPTNAVPVAEISLMMNLGYAIKSREISALVDAVKAVAKD
ncbi:trypsin-like peptidase domain-containing protein [Bradyrhizobium sp. LVM 105]|uniref:trypsin-like peptidase domain-containing protein n=1 Tax=Bradyrhizobium sp. LVM 105 TaxID=2341115 RepID=UPI000F80EC54|nr:trypsin-like peptidase domain-containing protein [Bradyrhizobium sp. LVM 105]RTE90666.1 serine protease [Bradyrhizobium sp. LVM 105]